MPRAYEFVNSRSLAVWFRANTSPRCRRAYRRADAWPTAYMAGYPLRGPQRPPCTMALSTTWTRQRDGVQDRWLPWQLQERCPMIGGAVLLEPIMKVEVVTPEENMGDVVGDLNRRRGLIAGHGRDSPSGKVDQRGGAPGRDVWLRDRPAFTRPRAVRPTPWSSPSVLRRRRTNIAEEIISKKTA